MIGHFVRADFRSNRVLWIVTLVLSFICCLVGVNEPEGLLTGAVLAFLLAMIGCSQVSGAKVRNQHRMSRNYLLSLPVARKRLFFIVMMRAWAFYLPLIFFALFAVLIYVLPTGEGWIRALAFAALLPPLVFLSSASTIWSGLRGEQILEGHTSQQLRFRQWVLLFMTAGPEVGATLIIPNLAIFHPLWCFVILPVLFAYAYYRFTAARRLWIGS